MDAIDRPPEDASGKPGRRGARTRASYSLAPCAHLFVRVFRFILWRTDLSFFLLVVYDTVIAYGVP